MAAAIGWSSGFRRPRAPGPWTRRLIAFGLLFLTLLSTGAMAASKPPAPEGAQNFIVKAASRPPAPEGAQNLIVKAASRPPIAVKLTQAQQAEVERVENYLNTIRTLRAKFLQVADNGALAEGSLLMSRPGLMRMEYDPPSPHLIVADGLFLIYHEKKLNQTSHIPLSSSLAGFLIRDVIKLAGDVTLTRFEQDKGVIRLTLVKTDDGEAGQMTLVLSDGPLQLRQWTVSDGQGGTTRITLANAEFGVPLDKALFAFTPPQRDRFDR